MASVIRGNDNFDSATVGSTTLGAVGTYALLGTTNAAVVSPGATTAGSNLRYSSAYGYNSSNHGLGPTSPSAGTWRCMGNSGAYNFSESSGLANASSVYLRIS